MTQVCVQLPDYMLERSVSISSEFERLLGYRVYILGDTSYGRYPLLHRNQARRPLIAARMLMMILLSFSCCVDETAAQHIAADCIVHFGRTCLTPNNHLPVYYILPRQPLDLDRCANVIAKTFGTSEEPILLLYDVAYHHLRGITNIVHIIVLVLYRSVHFRLFGRTFIIYEINYIV